MINSKLIVALVFVLLISGCSKTSHLRLDLMPTPLIYQDENAENLLAPAKVENAPYEGVLYATDRAPVPYEERFDKLSEYSQERNDFLNVGLNTVIYNRFGKEQLSVAEVETYGALTSVPLFGPLTNPERIKTLKSADEYFAQQINSKLAISNQKDVFVYVHGAHDSFENPALIAGELWHHLGYEGALVNFLWPTTRARFGYFKDVENAQASGTSLRLLIDYLSNNTDAEKIHLISHSAGGRVVVQALYEKALAGTKRSDTKIGEVLLIASDYGSTLLGIAISQGIAQQAEKLTIYVSSEDTALGVSRFLFKSERLGQWQAGEVVDRSIVEFFDNSNLRVIDVTSAEQVSAAHGHSYFRTSPWVSSDVVATLRLGLTPGQRGLVRSTGALPWTFPMNYPDVLNNRLKAISVNK